MKLELEIVNLKFFKSFNIISLFNFLIFFKLWFFHLGCWLRHIMRKVWMRLLVRWVYRMDTQTLRHQRALDRWLLDCYILQMRKIWILHNRTRVSVFVPDADSGIGGLSILNVVAAVVRLF